MSSAAIRGRLGAHEKWARTDDREAATASARAAARTSLEQKLTTEYALDVAAADYELRLSHARSAYFARLAMNRRRKK